MNDKNLDFDSVKLLLSLVIPAGCTITFIPGSTYRIHCPNYHVANLVWKNQKESISPLLKKGAVVEVTASDFYARSYPKVA